MKKEKKIILSTGLGPLHLINSAKSIKEYVDIKIIQGWVPNNPEAIQVKLLSKLVGHKHLASGLRKRKPVELKNKIISCWTPEFLYWGGLILNKLFGFTKQNEIAGFAWRFFGHQSKKYINSADIFHVRSGAGRGGAISKAKKNQMKVVVDHSIAHPSFMDKNLKEEYKKFEIPFNYGLSSPLFKSTIEDANEADCLLVNSFFVKKTFIDEGYPESKIKVAYLGVREDFMGIKNNYISEKKIKLLFTGSFGFRKGGEYLLKALQQLEKENFDFEMKIIGSYESAKFIINKYPVKNVDYLGFIPQNQLKDYLADSDIYVFPSLCEGCASSGMEAMAAGLPVIATEESGLPISDGNDGLIIPGKSSDRIVEAVKKLSQNNILRKKIGENAAKKIKENYTWKNYGNTLNEIYNNV